MFELLSKIFGTKNDRVIKQYRKQLSLVHAVAVKLTGLSMPEVQLSWQQYLRQPHTDKIEHRATVFAYIQAFSERILQKRHYDVQLLGGMVLSDGMVAEMGTGEGKTLVATLPAIYQALEGRKVFVVTVNDYLAQRDAEWMKPLYESFGLSVGTVLTDDDYDSKKKSYDCSIIYVTNNRLGFDYLDDRTALSYDKLLLPPLDFAIIDEVDSILIDEARLPMIISAPQDQDMTLYPKLHVLAQKLIQSPDLEHAENGDFTLDLRTSQITLTETGHEKVEKNLRKMGFLAEGQSLYDPEQALLMHHVMCALRAIHLFHRDREYLVIDGKVVLVDEHTGRLSHGRRLSEGLHQAIEAKEGVEILRESVTMASITYQNFFKLFKTISGMTGTAANEAEEFHDIYQLEVVVIPPNRPKARIDHPDLVFFSREAQEKAIIEAIIKHHELGRPVLVGTRSIEQSEHISQLLTATAQIPHVVLNAKNHAAEAAIIAKAGTRNAVTIATNMAGRGTDVILAGPLSVFIEEHPELDVEQARLFWEKEQEEIRQLGGLQVLGLERHDSRRIDLQLMGRSGRQGDPGSSQFYISFEDHLMKTLPQNFVKLMQYCQNDPMIPITDPMMDKHIERTQKAREGYHFDMRKQSLEEDNVINDQRQVIYACRDRLLEGENPREFLELYRQEVAHQLLLRYGLINPNNTPGAYPNYHDLSQHLLHDFGVTPPSWEDISYKDWESTLVAAFKNEYEQHLQGIEPQWVLELERDMMLRQLDLLWRMHLGDLENAKQQVSLRSYAQKDPRQEYKIEAFKLFEALMQQFAFRIVQSLLRVRIRVTSSAQGAPETPAVNTEPTPEKIDTSSDSMRKRGRNEVCDCGSQKKFKHCCGAANL